MSNLTRKPETTVNIFASRASDTRSPFDLDKLTNKFKHQATDWTLPEAYIAILIAAAMADGHFTPEEQGAIQTLVMRSRALRSVPPSELAQAEQSALAKLRANSNALQEACATLSAEMCLPVFAHCVDIILSDGDYATAEGEFLDRLVPMLDIPPDHAQRVLEVLLLKAQY